MTNEHNHHHDEHHEHHPEEGGMRHQLMVIGASALLLAAAVLTERYASLTTWQLLLVYLVPYLMAGHETLHEAWEGICEGDMFNEHFLMTVATSVRWPSASCRVPKPSSPRPSS